MRVPKSCPAVDYKALVGLPPETQARVLEVATPLPTGKYLHWDELRHRPVPMGLTHEEWWSGIAFARSNLRKPLPVPQKGGQAFHYCQVDPVIEMTLEIDKRASGQIAMAEPVADPKTRDRYVVRSLIEEAITSSQLEGAATTARVARDMLRTGRKPATRDERMIVNNFAAMEMIKEMQSVARITLADILTLHSVLTDGTLDDPGAAGRFRRADEEIIVRDTMNKILHVPPAASELPARMTAMIKFANEERAPRGFVHPVVKAIVLHFWLAYDHPFVDGNGRTARALFYWSMLSQGYWLAEFVSVSSVLKKAPSQYARSYLQSETSHGDATYFILHQLRVFLRSIDALDEYLNRKVDEQRETQQRMHLLGVLNHRQVALVTHALKHPEHECTIEWHKRMHRVVYETARRDLLEMEELGLFDKVRRGKAFHFHAVDDFENRLAALSRDGHVPGHGS